MTTRKLYKDQNVNDLTTGFIATISEHGQDFDLAHQTTAPLNFRDTRDFRNYRHDLSSLKDSILVKFRTTEDSEEKVKLILTYRFLQRYHKSNPQPINDANLIMHTYLSARMDSQILPDSFAEAHKRSADALINLQLFVVDAIHNLQLPSWGAQQQATFFPSFDRFSTLTKAEKAKQDASKMDYEALAKDLTSAL